MNRYFLVHDDHLPSCDPNDGKPNVGEYGAFQFLSLASHGTAGDGWHLLVLGSAASVSAHSEWLALPPLIDQKTRLDSVIPVEVLSDIGVTGDHTSLDLALIAGAIIPSMSV